MMQHSRTRGVLAGLASLARVILHRSSNILIRYYFKFQEMMSRTHQHCHFSAYTIPEHKNHEGVYAPHENFRTSALMGGQLVID